MGADSVTGALVPGYVTQSDGQDVYAVSNSSWSEMMDRVDSGQEPAEQTQEATTDPGSFTITLKNGGGITGAAASMESTLTSKGFKVSETGNTDTSVYGETLVIYNSSDAQPAAQTVLNAMGVGRSGPEHRRLLVWHRCAGYSGQGLETLIVTPSKRPIAPSGAVVESLMMNIRPKGKGEPHG